MIAFQSQFRVFLYRTPTDMRKSFHGLIALTESALKQDPLSRSLFVFLNSVAIDQASHWGQTGFSICHQQLQQGNVSASQCQGDRAAGDDRGSRQHSCRSFSTALISLGRQRWGYQLPREMLTVDSSTHH